MSSYTVIKRFRDNVGRDYSRMSVSEKSELSVYAPGDSYESTSSEWTEYLVKRGFLQVSKPKTKRKRASVQRDGEGQ